MNLEKSANEDHLAYGMREFLEYLSIKDCETIAGNVKAVEQRKKIKNPLNAGAAKGHTSQGDVKKTVVLQEVQDKWSSREILRHCESEKGGKLTNTSRRNYHRSDKKKHAESDSKKNVCSTEISNGSANVNVTHAVTSGRTWDLRTEKANVTMKKASGDRVNIRGKLKCTIDMKGSKSLGYA
ncbi:hypothetical protein OSTOST_01442 [Ostertagia ostertagi]